MSSVLTANRREHITRNLVAGTTTAVVLIPQAMAYALVAGLPPIHGLYASVLPLIVYAVLGRSRQLAVGPGAIDTLLVGAALGAMHLIDEQSYAAYAALLAVMVAAIQACLGLLRAGFLVNFLSRPVISGFTTAAALTIALSQIRHLLGFDAAGGRGFLEIAGNVVRGIGDTHLPTAILGLAAIAALVWLKRWRKGFPGALFVVAISTAVTAWLGLDGHGVRVVGDIPAGLPAFQLPAIDAATVLSLLPTAITLALIGYLTIISIGQTFANRNGYEIRPNRELFAIGGANFAAGLSQGFPVSASFSRSAVHAGGGASSPYALLVVAGWVALTLLLLTGLFSKLPTTTLAAIIITSVIGLTDFPEIRRLARVKRADMWLLLITFAATLLVGIEQGILVGVGASLMLFVYRTTRPHAAVLGRIADTRDYRNLRNYPDAITVPGVLIVRIDAQFYFGNVTFLRDFLRKQEASLGAPLQAVIIEACSLNQLDSSADAALRELAAAYAARDVVLKFANVKRPVSDVMRASGLWHLVGEANIHMNVHDAVQSLAPTSTAST
jgi:sulfate permease, SulP family